MPWKNSTTMDQKIEFICEWLTSKYTITELCNSFEISRPTAYRLISRYEKYGIEGLREHSKAPINHPNRTNKNVEDKILHLKENIEDGEPISIENLTVHVLSQGHSYIFSERRMVH